MSCGVGTVSAGAGVAFRANPRGGECGGEGAITNGGRDVSNSVKIWACLRGFGVGERGEV